MFDTKMKKAVSVQTTAYLAAAGSYYYAGTAAATWYLPYRQPTAPQRRNDSAVFLVTCEIGAGPLTISGLDANFSYGASLTTSITLMPGESVLIHDDGLVWIASFMPTATLYRRVAAAQTGTALTLTRSAYIWPFTGTAAATWTLPAISLNRGAEFVINNRGTAAITLAPNGSDTFTAGVTTVTSPVIPPGRTVTVVNDGSTWIVRGEAVKHLASGKYYGAHGAPMATGTPTQDRLRLFPWVVPETAIYDRIGSLVTTEAASATLRWGIYNDVAGRPSTPILDTGAVGDASTTGWKEATIDQVLVAGERVWLGVVAQGGDPTLRTFSGSTSIADVGGTSAEIAALSSSATAGVFQAGVTGALPTYSGTQSSNVAVAIWLRRS